MITSWLQGVILGAIQGITEWLPISSEGINTLISLQFFQTPLPESISISLWLHSGTLLAALIYFRRDIIMLSRHLPKYLTELRTHQASGPTHLITFLIIATVLSGTIGAPLFSLSLSIEAITASLAMAIIGGFLIITGFVQRFALKSVGNKTVTTKRDAVVVGIVQALSVLPGFSRSGLTISTLLFQGYQAKETLRISFLMSIPAMTGAVVALSIIKQITFNPPIMVSMATAMVFGWLTINVLFKIANRVPFWIFCLVLGVLSQLPLIIEAFR